MRNSRHRLRIGLLYRALSMIPGAAAAPAFGTSRVLTMDDVLDFTSIDRAALSPDGEWAAVVVLRSARPGKVYGRNFYDVDPSRGDVWLISRRTGEKRNLTQGAKLAAGFWCATWSPDGSKLAMLSTKPEGKEPIGGDNVRLYVWDRVTGALARKGDAAMLTQTRTPLYRLDVRGGTDGSTVAHRCHSYENAPFAWLDNQRLLAVTLPPGEVSGLIDEYARSFRHAKTTQRDLRAGARPTVSAAGSGKERVVSAEQASVALLHTINADTGVATTISTVPAYPFRGDLTLSISPDSSQLAVLATTGTIPPNHGSGKLKHDTAWLAEKRLGFADMRGGSVRWAELPAAAKYPLELFAWSPDARSVAFRARDNAGANVTPLFVASASDLAVDAVGPSAWSIGGQFAGAEIPREPTVFWVDGKRLLVKVPAGNGSSPTALMSGARSDWWLVTPGVDPVNLTGTMPKPPAALRRSGNERFFAVDGNEIKLVKIGASGLETESAITLAGKGSIAWPQDAGRATSDVLVAVEGASTEQVFQEVSLAGAGKVSRSFSLPRGVNLLDADPARGAVLWSEATEAGLHLRATALDDKARRDLLSLNTHLAEIQWGRKRLIDYRSADGEELKAAVILPPGFRADRRYPTITWVYGGNRVTGLNDYFLQTYMAGFYNLQLYASRGYVVLIPSMPISPTGQKIDSFLELSKGVLPAVDRLVELGITDPARVGVMGQSFGGYSVYSLVAQTDRFKAAVAMAGITDLVSLYYQFDTTARNYPGIEHEKSENRALVEGPPWSLGVSPYEDHTRYWRNSPLAYVDRVETPLLMIHGEHDVRGPMTQSESFFYGLYRQGKTARLLRYWGENHGLSQSPANVRNVFEETVGWFDKYLVAAPEQRRTTSGSRPYR